MLKLTFMSLSIKQFLLNLHETDTIAFRRVSSTSPLKGLVDLRNYL